MDYEEKYYKEFSGKKILVGMSTGEKYAGELLEYSEHAIWIRSLSGGSRLLYKIGISFVDEYDESFAPKEKNYNR